jgi:hypothetical protein
MSWSRFLNSPEGKQGILFLKLSCPKAFASGDDALIKNAVGFEFWQNCIDAMEKLGEVPPRNTPEPDETLE